MIKKVYSYGESNYWEELNLVYGDGIFLYDDK
jgi:hypothetical protein